MATPRHLLLTTSTYAYLEPSVLAAGDFERGSVERKSFPDGERYLRIASEVWGRDVVLLGGTPSDLDWLEVYDPAAPFRARVRVRSPSSCPTSATPPWSARPCRAKS
ncbi:MAG: hypothetical protein U0263_12060 [Polyangiaceae bacterium]